MASADAERTLAFAWKEYADACLEHDLEHARHASADLARLIPAQEVRDTECSKTK